MTLSKMFPVVLVLLAAALVTEAAAQAGLEDQAELVAGRYRRQDDPARCPAFHVQARGRDGCRDQGQPRHLCVPAQGHSRAH